MPLLKEKPSRHERTITIDGEAHDVNLRTVPLDMLRKAIRRTGKVELDDGNIVGDQDIVSLREVFTAMKDFMRFPHHATHYDMETYLHPVLNRLSRKIEDEQSITAFWKADPSRGHHLDEYYMYVADLLNHLDTAHMPGEELERYSKYNSETYNGDSTKPGERLPLDFRRAALAAMGDAHSYLAAYLRKGSVVRYVPRTEEESRIHRARMKKIEEDRHIYMTEGRRFQPWISNVWDKVLKGEDEDAPKRKDKRKDKSRARSNDDHGPDFRA